MAYRLLIVLTMTYSAALVARPAGAVSATRQQAPLPEAPGKAVVEKVCTTCHGTEYITIERTVPAWRETIELMKAFGTVATDEEWKTVNVYIMANVAYLQVNRAPAEDFAAVFGVDEKTASEVVAYREKAGPFKTVDDLKKAPGLPAATVDAAQARLKFEL